MGREAFSLPFFMYQPVIAYPESITNAENAFVTTTDDHTFVVGQSVKFIIPISCQMIQLNGKIGTILDVSDDTFTVDINTIGFNTFVPSEEEDYEIAQILPIGDVNFGYVFEEGTSLNRVLGSFIKT